MFHAILDHEVRRPAFRNGSTYDKAELLKMRLNGIPGSQGDATMRREFKRPFKALMFIVGLVLLTACSSLARLLTARAASRQREIAVRLALGSSRRRMIQQLLTEGPLLAVAGALAGIAMAVVMVKGLVAFLPAPSAAMTFPPLSIGA